MKIYILIFILSIIGMLFPWSQGIASSIIASYIISVSYYVIHNLNRVMLIVKCSTKYRNTFIRFSISYLFKIKINGDYLLIRGNRIKNQFQPVGGVYKRFASSNGILAKFELSDDDCVPLDNLSEGDLRIRVKGRYVPEFLEWYEKGLDREHSVYREFKEELLDTNILLQQDFKHIQYKYLRRHQTNIRDNKFFNCKEILIAEIFELMPNDIQKLKLEELHRIESDNYIWADEETIKSMGVKKGINISSNIAETASWLL